MSRIFLSHSSLNDTEAIDIKDWIEANGWAGEVFLDLDPERGLVAGVKWEAALKQAVHRCEAVLPLISKEWLTSKWCLSEVGTARILGKHIIPILIDDTDISALPADMTSEQIVDRKGDPQWAIRLKEGLKRANLDPKTFYFEEGRRPYPGLMALTEKDAAIFFGRDAQIVRGLDRLRALKAGGIERLMVILGASGSGKSSFLRAGLWPRLDRDDRNFLPIAVIRPELAVLSGKLGLYQALAETANANPNRKSNLIARNLPTNKGDIEHYVLDHGLQSYLAGLRDASSFSLPDGKASSPLTAVLCVDQAEELFGPAGSSEADLILDILTKALSNDQKLIVIFAIRSDAYPQLQSDARLTKLSQNEANLFNLAPMKQGSYRTVIEGPAKLVTPNPLVIEPQLTDALLEDSSGADALPLLAFTLERLYENYGHDGDLTLEEYKKMGRLEGAIEAAVKDSYNKALKINIVKDKSEFETAIKAAFIPHLADVNDADQFVRRVAAMEKLPSHTHDVISLLANQHLLIKDRRGSDNREQDVVEVAHEALLREWPLLRGWLEEEKDNIRAIGAVSRSAAEWKKNGLKEEWLVHTGERLSEATKLSMREDMQNRVGGLEKKYLKAALEKEESNRREREEQQKREQALKTQSERRKRLVTRISILASVVATILTVWAFSSYIKANDEAIKANEQRLAAVEAKKEAEEKAELARRGTYNIQLARVRDLWLHNPAQALDFLNDPTLAPTDLRDFTWGFFYRLSKRTRITMTGHTGEVRSVAFSPDGKTLASASGDKTIKLWEAKTGQVRATLTGHTNWVYSVAFSPDGKTLASASGDKTIKLWEAENGQMRDTLTGHTKQVFSVAFSPDGKTLASASQDKTIKLWDSQTGLERTTLTGHTGRVIFMAFSPDGETLSSASSDGTIKQWEVATDHVRATLSRHIGRVDSVAFSPDGKTLASAPLGYINIKLWDLQTGQERATLTQHTKWGANSVAFSPDSKTLALAGNDKTIKLWDAQTGQERATLTGHTEGVIFVAFSPDGKTMATASKDGTIKLWEAETTQESATLSGHRSFVHSVAFSPDGRTLASGSFDNAIRLWEVETGQVRTAMRGRRTSFNSVAFSPDGKTLASASYSIRLWEVETGKLVWLSGGSLGFYSVAFSPDGNTLASASDDKTVNLWDAQTGQVRATLTGHTASVGSVAFSPDGNTLASASDDKTVKLWDAQTGQVRATLTGHTESVGFVAFSPDVKTLASASGDKTIKLWDAKTGQVRATLTGHTASVGSVDFSPDGKTLASASDDWTIKLWKAASSEMRSETREAIQ